MLNARLETRTTIGRRVEPCIVDDDFFASSTMRTADDLTWLERLLSDPRLSKLEEYKPPLSLFRSLGVERDELAHSRLLAELLDPRRHGGAESMLRLMLSAIASAVPDDPAERIAEIVAGTWKQVRIRRELMRIDIVIELSTTDGELVLGIENKIDAREREKQLSTHQEALLRVFPNRICVMAFLTPTGRRGITASECAVPCVDIGYELVLKAVHKTMQDAKERSDKRVLEEVAAHLEEEILEKREVHRIVRDIWAAHPRALEFLFEHRPRIEDVHISFEGKLRERFGSDAQFTHYPTRGHMREIKMHLESWSSRGFPFTFMLYASDGEPPHVRVLLFKDGYEEFRSPLTRWARDVNREHGSVIDEQFAPLPDWNKQWRRVLAEEYYPPSAVLDERAFDGATAEAAAERVIALVEFLRPHVEKMTT